MFVYTRSRLDCMFCSAEQATFQIFTALLCSQLLKMPVAYSEDLRWRAIWLNIVRGLSYADIAKVLFMSEKSVYRYVRQFHSTGRVEPMRATGNHSN